MNAFFALVVIVTWRYTQPELSRMAEFRVDWIVQNYVRNLAMLVLFAGGIHLWLYTFRGQGTSFKFNPKWMGGKSPTFLWGDQLRDNMFWSIASGVTVWTAYEALMMWSYANGHLATADWDTQPVYFAVLLSLLVMWHMVHFYFGHRLIHWKPLYRSVHYLHHKNVNVGPWTGLAMHPVEHIVYFSTVPRIRSTPCSRFSSRRWGPPPVTRDSTRSSSRGRSSFPAISSITCITATSSATMAAP